MEGIADASGRVFRPVSAVRGKRLSPVRKRVRWADEERMQRPAIIAVIILNALFLLMGVLGRWGLWTEAVVQSQGAAAPARPMHEIRGAAPVGRAGPHDARRQWPAVARRQEPAAPSAGNGSAPLLPLQTFEVDVPLLGPNGSVVGAGTPAGFQGIETTGTATANNGTTAGCQVTLAVNTFASSFGSPFVGNYTPPSCVGDSNTVVMNLTVTSQGRQFDRLSIM